MTYQKALNNIFKKEDPPIRVLKITGKKIGVDVFGRTFSLVSTEGYSKDQFVLVQSGVIIEKASPYETPTIQNV